MIDAQCSPRGCDRILLRFANGWTASVAPQFDGRALLAAWGSHEDRPRAGWLNVVGAELFDADGIVGFLTVIASTAPVERANVESVKAEPAEVEPA